MEKIGVRETQEKPRQIKKNSKGGGTGQKSREKYSRGRNREQERRCWTREFRSIRCRGVDRSLESPAIKGEHTGLTGVPTNMRGSSSGRSQTQ